MDRRSVGTRVRFLAVLAALWTVSGVAAESLWSPGFRGYILPQPIAPGDALTVMLDASTRLSLVSTARDSRSASVAIEGGEAGELLSFLPAGSATSDLELSRSHELEVKAEIPVLVERVDSGRGAYVRGTRTVAVDGRRESLEVSGWYLGAAAGSRAPVPFSALAEALLVVRTSIEPSTGPLDEGSFSPAPAELPAEGSESDAGGPLTLEPAARRALLLRYLNRIVDLLGD